MTDKQLKRKLKKLEQTNNTLTKRLKKAEKRIKKLEANRWY